MKFAVATFAALCLANTAQADTEQAFRAIGLAGSERLAVFALSDPLLPDEAREERANILLGAGFGLEAGTVAASDLHVSTFLAWDDNLNGGFARNRFSFGGLDFEVDPDYHARAGVLAGIDLNGQTAISLGGPTVLDLRVGGMLGYAPQHDMAKAFLGGEACVRHLRSPELGLHACLDAAYSRIDLGASGRIGLNAGASRSFAAFGGYHDASVEFGTTMNLGDTDYRQGVLGLRLTSAHGDGVATDIAVKFGAPVEGVHVMRARIDLSATVEIAERPVSFTLGVERDEGGDFIGEAYRDETYSISVTGEISERMSAMISLTDVRSSEDFFDNRSIGFGVNYHF